MKKQLLFQKKPTTKSNKKNNAVSIMSDYVERERS